jgi:hypothetical protein
MTTARHHDPLLALSVFGGLAGEADEAFDVNSVGGHVLESAVKGTGEAREGSSVRFGCPWGSYGGLRGE